MKYWKSVSIGCLRSAKGAPLIIVGGKIAGTVDQMKEWISEHEQNSRPVDRSPEVSSYDTFEGNIEDWAFV